MTSNWLNGKRFECRCTQARPQLQSHLRLSAIYTGQVHFEVVLVYIHCGWMSTISLDQIEKPTHRTIITKRDTRRPHNIKVRTYIDTYYEQMITTDAMRTYSPLKRDWLRPGRLGNASLGPTTGCCRQASPNEVAFRTPEDGCGGSEADPDRWNTIRCVAGCI